MLKLTSDLDFNLTKKRFLMMARKVSPLRSNSKKFFLIPVLGLIAMLFCTKSEQGVEEILYPSVRLTTVLDTTVGDIYGRAVFLGPDGKPFTGTIQYRFKDSDSLFLEQQYEDGQSTVSIGYDQNGLVKGRYEYGMIAGQRVMTRHYLGENTLVEEWTNPFESQDSLGHIREWHPNGQLKFETSYKGKMSYEGLMTLYNEQGHVLRQERYKDGKLIEKIK